MPLIARLLAHRRIVGKHWIWTGHIRPDGRGSLGRQLAHRLSWRAFRGPIPKGKSVLHSCDIAACFNPACLFLGTQADNIADMVAKKRHPIGSQKKLAKLHERDIPRIRKLLSDGFTQKAVADIFHINQSNVSRAARGERWRHVCP